MKNMMGRALVSCWTVVGGSVLLLIFISKPAKLPLWLPGPQTLRVFLVLLVLLSVAYGLVRLYRQGMKLTRKK